MLPPGAAGGTVKTLLGSAVREEGFGFLWLVGFIPRAVPPRLGWPWAALLTLPALTCGDVARSRSEAETAAGNSDSATAPTRYRNTELHHGGNTLFVDSLRVREMQVSGQCAAFDGFNFSPHPTSPRR